MKLTKEEVLKIINHMEMLKEEIKSYSNKNKESSNDLTLKTLDFMQKIKKAEKEDVVFSVEDLKIIHLIKQMLKMKIEMFTLFDSLTLVIKDEDTPTEYIEKMIGDWVALIELEREMFKR